MRTNFEPARRSTSNNHVNVMPMPERIHAALETAAATTTLLWPLQSQ